MTCLCALLKENAYICTHLIYPPPCNWNLYGAQSLNLTLSPAKATWTATQITTTPMHIGDICNLGIFCVAPSSNRNLLDFISETVDPKGCAHIAYADDNTVNKLRAANQTSGTCLIGKNHAISTTTNLATAGLLVPAGAAVAWVGRRRQDRSGTPGGT